jgi:carboxymethylenebutenolidase
MGETIRLTASDGHAFDAYLARPASKPKGGVVVIQEIFGVNGHMRSVTDRYAAAGYLAVAPAIFDRTERGVELGYVPDDIARGRDLRAEIDMADVIKDVAAAADVAAEGGKVGIVGYCWGGLIVYVASCRLGDKLTAGSGYYGGNIKSFINEKPAIPLMLHFGTLDASIPMEDVDAIRKAHPAIAVHIYEGADHGFNCDQRKQFNPEAAKLAGERTLAFFAEQLS